MPDDKLDLSKDPTIIELTRLVRGLVTISQQQGAALNAVRADIAKGVQNVDDDDDDDDNDGNDDVDPDKMSNKEFMAHMLKHVGKIMDDKIGDVTKKVDTSTNEYRMGELRKQAAKMQEDHKDFSDWKDEMTALSKLHPTLTLSQLYRMARDENPDKVKELDTKYADKADDKEKPNESLTLFGGYRPTTKTSGGGKDGEGDKPEKLTIDQALEKGWEDAVANFPALGKMEDVLD